MSADELGGNGKGNGNGQRSRFFAGAGQGAGGNGFSGPAVNGPVMPEFEPEGLTLRDYIGVVWRRKWIIALVVIVAAGSAYYFASKQTKMYSTSGTIIYKQQLDLADPLNTGYTDVQGIDREMASINDMISGPTLQAAIGAILKKEGVDGGSGFSVTAAQASSGSSSSNSSSAGSNVVVFTGDSASPALAAAGANAAAQAYVDWNQELQRKQISAAIPVVQTQLNKYGTPESKLTSDYVMLKQRLQDLQILQATATGNYQVLSPAPVPVAPYAPKPLRSAILGFAVGLFAGIGLAFLLEQFDTRVRKPDQIAALLRLPILGRIPKIRTKTINEPLPVTLRHPDGHIAESFRMVRTNLDFMAVDNDVNSIAITSCMKGEGKSVCLANLAVTMALAGKKVVIVDADLRRPRQHKFFGAENKAGVSTVAAGTSTLLQSLVPVQMQAPDDGGPGHKEFADWSKGADSQSRLYLLPSGPLPPNPGEIVSSRRFATIIETLTQEADLVMVDTPAMLAVGDTSAIAANVDGLVFLADMHMIRKPQLMTAADQLMRLPTKMLGIVVRLYGKRGSRYYYAPGYYYKYSYSQDGAKSKQRHRNRHRRETDKTQA